MSLDLSLSRIDLRKDSLQNISHPKIVTSYFYFRNFKSGKMGRQFPFNSMKTTISGKNN